MHASRLQCESVARASGKSARLDAVPTQVENDMEKNVGSIDKTLRIVAGLAILSLLLLLEGSARWFGLIGLVPLFTGLFGYCPAYRLIGMNTCPLKPGRG